MIETYGLTHVALAVRDAARAARARKGGTKDVRRPKR